MRSKAKKTGIKVVISLILMMTFVVTGAFSLVASAVVGFGNSGDVITGGVFTTQTFSVTSDNILTVSAKAEVKAGSPSGVKLQLQKNGFFGWTTIDTKTIGFSSNIISVWVDKTISKNSSYRILCTCEGSGANVATVSIGVVSRYP